MRITRRQLTRLIKEAQKSSTEKYDDDSALTGDQDELPDGLQKGIIDKTVEDREEANEGMILEGSLQGAEERFTEALSEYVMVLDENQGYDVPHDQLKAEVMNLVDGHFEYLEDYEKNPGKYQ